MAAAVVHGYGVGASTRLSWQPGRGTLVVLAIAALVGGWLLSPPWWNRLGNDSQVFYAAATLAADGGDPYDFTALTAEERHIHDALPPASQVAFSPAPYAYPPLMTALWQVLLPLGERGFYWANVAILLAAGLLGIRLVTVALGFRDRAVAMVAMTVSAPLILGLVAGNPSNLLLLAWAAALYAFAGDRPVVGGALLAIGLLKAPVGLAAAAALILGSAAIPAAAVGFFAGSALFLALNLLALGPGALHAWLGGLGGYSTTLGGGVAGGYQQCCLAGLPGLLADHLPIAVATLVAAVAVVAAIGVAATRPGWRLALRRDPLARLALVTAALLAVSPYLHLNDLVLEAVPLLFVASRRLTPVGRVLLITWGMGVIPSLAISLALGLALHTQVVSSIGFGILLSAGTLLAVIVAIDARPRSARPRSARQGDQPAWGPSAPAAASQRR